MQHAHPSQAYILLSIAALLWGGNSVAGKIAADLWPPMLLTSARWACALLILAPLLRSRLRRDWPAVRCYWPLLLGLGAGGMCLFNVGMFTALHYTSAINVSIEQASMPVLIMLANFLLLSQRVTALQIAGLIVSIVGVVVTVSGGQPLRLISEGLNRGDALMLLACVFYAAYTFGLRWRPRIDWLSFLACVALGAFLASLPFALWESRTHSVPALTGEHLAVLLYIVVFPTMISQIAYARGVELIGGNRAGLFINLVPVFGSLLAVLVVGERFQVYHGIGLVLVVGGILFAERNAARQVRALSRG